MKRGMTFEYLKCRADLNFEVDFRVNGVIGAVVILSPPMPPSPEATILNYLNDRDRGRHYLL